MRNFYAISDKEIKNGVHVILAHGLGGDPEETWVQMMQEFDWTRALESEREWIKVWKFGHNISLRKSFFCYSSVTDVSLKLINEVKENRLIDTGNIIFVAHSLGGIISKLLFKELNDFSKIDNECLGIIRQIKGVVLLAAPHNGSKFAIAAEDIVSNLSKLCIIKYFFNKEIIDQLKPDNEFLLKLDQEYGYLFTKYYFEHMDFWEGKETNFTEYANKKKVYGLLYSKKNIEEKLDQFKISQNAKFVVERHRQEYNRIGGSKIIDNTDHFSICKLKNTKCDVYEKILSLLERTYKNFKNY